MGSYRRLGISIHAPTRGATDNWTYKFSDTSISIHAPTRGATQSGDYEGLEQ